VGIKEVIEMINSMQADGVIERYAIGGAVGATFYLEPVATLDVDVFVEFHTEPGSRIASREPIFKFLRDRGCPMENEHVVIAGWPVQFLRAGSPLLQEASAISCFPGFLINESSFFLLNFPKFPSALPPSAFLILISSSVRLHPSLPVRGM
jgi:hypothetical protein